MKSWANAEGVDSKRRDDTIDSLMVGTIPRMASMQPKASRPEIRVSTARCRCEDSRSVVILLRSIVSVIFCSLAAMTFLPELDVEAMSDSSSFIFFAKGSAKLSGNDDSRL